MRRIGELGHSLSWWLAALCLLLGVMAIAQARGAEGFEPPHRWHMGIGVAYCAASIAAAVTGISRLAVGVRVGTTIAAISSAALLATEWL